MVEIQRLRFSSAPTVEMLNPLLKQLDPDGPGCTEGVLEHILRSDSQVYVLLDDGWIIGTATLVPVQLLSGYKCWIEDVVVDQQYRGKGYGRMLMQHLIAAVPPGTKSINLTSSETRMAARSLYESLGFVQRGDSNLFRLTVRP